MNKKISVLLLSWVLLLFGVLGYLEMQFMGATEVVLKTIPVDPNDFFRGDYVRLQYDFSQIHEKGLVALPTMIGSGSHMKESPFPVVTGKTLYAQLKKEGDEYIFDTFTQEKAQDSVALKGSIVDAYDGTGRVLYGIEEYFVPQGEGKVWEKELGGDLRVRVLVNPNGETRLKELFLKK